MADRTDQATRNSDESDSVVVVSHVENRSENGESQEYRDILDDDKVEKKHTVGFLAESKDLYAKYHANGHRSWTETKPEDFQEVVENEETARYALIVRKMKPRDTDSGKSLVIHSIVIQSPYLKRLLGKVLDGCPGILTNVARLTLKAPFECIVHRWESFMDACENIDGMLEADALAHVELLQSIMQKELGAVIELRADYLRNRAVAFEHVWTIFSPGCIILGEKTGKPVAARFSKGEYDLTSEGDRIYVLKGRIIDWDGTNMGWTDLGLSISSFSGTLPFTELPCYPLDCHPDPEAIKTQLLNRGRRFETLAGYCHRSYNGVALRHLEFQGTRCENVQSRIVVDGANWGRENQDRRIQVTPMRKENDLCHDKLKPPIKKSRFSGKCEDSAWSLDDECDDERDVSHCVAGTGAKQAERPPLTQEQLLMTSPVVRGYALKNKLWMEFYVDDIGEVEFDEHAYASLVLPQEKKELVLAFAKSQAMYKDSFDDIISGKGKGIIMLLSGGPGIGKTLTAESVAEEMRVPLYKMSASDLGYDALMVDDNLKRIFAMVANWNAVLLLDECEAFLEKRSADDENRNCIVAVFLRTLEYYEGILFLTTNRICNMDPALQSRIHVSLEYPALDAAARAAVWSSFLARTVSPSSAVRGNDAHEVSKENIATLSGLDLNGRVIKNVLKAANLLAWHRRERLAMRHIETVLRAEGRSL